MSEFSVGVKWIGSLADGDWYLAETPGQEAEVRAWLKKKYGRADDKPTASTRVIGVDEKAGTITMGTPLAMYHYGTPWKDSE
jgi:hypothetical protein